MSRDWLPDALNPRGSAVVSACAGSGKTWLLIARIVRILLSGADAGEILAITFTRKAAAEIEERVRRLLLRFAQADDAELRGLLSEICAPTDGETLSAARDLLNRHLLARPPMTIRTFHSWFLLLLQNRHWRPGAVRIREVTGHMRALEEEAWDRLLARSPEDSAEFAGALEALLGHGNVAGTKDLLRDFLRKGDRWQICFDGAGEPVAAAIRRFEEEANLGEDWETFDADAALNDSRAFSDAVGQLLAGDVVKDLDPAHGWGYETVWLAFFTKQNTVRQKVIKKADKLGLGEPLGVCVRELENLRERKNAVDAARYNRAALVAAAAWANEVARIKSERGIFEYGDLEIEAWRMMSGEEDAALALQYKLDCRYDHILIDEFQDTSPAQWGIVHAWLESAYSTDQPPKVFIVGDAKQAIYRFRGGEPALLEAAADYLEGRYGAVKCRNDLCRRCAPPIIDLVNAVFESASQSGAFEDYRPHTALNDDLPGRVEVSPLVSVEESEPPDMRNPLLQALPEDLRHAREGYAIAGKIREIVGHWSVRGENGADRPCEYGDIMLLFSRRTHAPALERALCEAGIPCRSDAGGFLGSLECGDILSLLTILVSPRQDLRFARVLRSPLFGVSETELFALLDAAGGSLSERLAVAASSSGCAPALARAHAKLVKWRDAHNTRRVPVHDFLDFVYGDGDVLNRYMASVPPHLRDSVVDNLDRLLEFSLSLDGGRHPQLARFVRRAETLAEVGDDDMGVPAPDGNWVSLSTVHRAKGLEKPVVILSDAAFLSSTSGGSSSIGKIICSWPPDQPRPNHFSVGRKGILTARQREIVDADARGDAREQLNQLYVAITRAQQALVVFGSASKKNPSEDTWYARISSAVEAMQQPGRDGPDGALVLGADLTGAPPPSSPDPDVAPVPPDPRPKHKPVGQPRPPQGEAARRGELRHRLIAMRLTGLDVEQCHALLPSCDERTFRVLWDETSTIASAPSLAPILAEAGRLSVSMEADFVNEGVRGRIDLLVEREECFWVVDFKTGDGPAADLAARHQEQMSRYRSAVEALHPDKPVRCALVAADGELVELS